MSHNSGEPAATVVRVRATKVERRFKRVKCCMHYGGGKKEPICLHNVSHLIYDFSFKLTVLAMCK